MKHAAATTWIKLINILVCALIFVLPTHFFLKWGLDQAYVRGLLIDYLLPKIYLADLIALAIIVIGGWHLKSHFKLNKPLIAFGITSIFLLASQFLSNWPLPATVMSLRLIGLCLLAAVLLNVKKYLNPSWLLTAIVATILFQSGLGLFQFLTQHSLVGYTLLGEPNLPGYAGLATASFFGAEKVLPYGTTAHPNVLGGVLAIYLSIALVASSAIKDRQRALQGLWGLALALGAITLGLTQSLSAWLALQIGLVLALAHFKSVRPSISYRLLPICFLIAAPILIAALSLILPNESSLTRRSYLSWNAVKLWEQNPVIGVGLTANAAAGEPLSAVQENVRFAQPTHYVPLLWLSETGVLGIIWLGSLVWVAREKLAHEGRRLWWLTLLPLAALDHYLLTSTAGLLLIVMIMTNAWLPEKD